MTGSTNIFIIQGDKDSTNVPYCGGSTGVWVPFPTQYVPRIDEEFQYWSSGLSCSAYSYTVNGTTTTGGSNTCTGGSPTHCFCTSGTPTSGFTAKTASSCTGSKQIEVLDAPSQKHGLSATYSNVSIFWNFSYPNTPGVQPQTQVKSMVILMAEHPSKPNACRREVK